MASTARARGAQIHELTRDEGQKLLEQEARRRLGMGADEFIHKWTDGDFGDADSNPDALELAMLLPFVGIDPWSDEHRPPSS